MVKEGRPLLVSHCAVAPVASYAEPKMWWFVMNTGLQPHAGLSQRTSQSGPSVCNRLWWFVRNYGLV
jgi:hypothetical protein